MVSTQLLDNQLTLLQPFFEDDDVAEIMINRPQELWLVRRQRYHRINLPALTWQYLQDLSAFIAAATEQMLDETRPLLSAYLSNGCRVQVVCPPAVALGTIAMAIRKPALHTMDLSQLASDYQCVAPQAKTSVRCTLRQLLSEGCQPLAVLRHAVKLAATVIIAGGTASGKTTLLNALLQEVDAQARIITLEDVPEIKLKQANQLGLFVSRGQQSASTVNMEDMLAGALRLRPDRLIMGELRGDEAFSFLRAVNTGHAGAMATLHADSAELALEQLALMVMQRGIGLSLTDIDQYVRRVVRSRCPYSLLSTATEAPVIISSALNNNRKLIFSLTVNVNELRS